MAYSEKVMDHFANPRNVGKLEDASGVGEVGNAKCGDIMKMYIKVENDVITDIKFNTYGCASAIATSSMATEMIKGKPLSEAMKLTNKAVIEALDGLPPSPIITTGRASRWRSRAATDTARAATFTKPKRAAALGKARKRAARRRLHEA